MYQTNQKVLIKKNKITMNSDVKNQQKIEIKTIWFSSRKLRESKRLRKLQKEKQKKK